ncbi:MAG: hypothetical protein JW850_14420, partial [Thermoflexales bacterium]|nr:hypothetical protein [Thermoflexales bacterium]
TTAGSVYGVVMEPPTAALSGNPGQAVTYTQRVTNTGNAPDTFALATSGNAWTVDVPASVGPLAAGAGADVHVVVQVPALAADGLTDTVHITVLGTGVSDYSVLTTTARIDMTPHLHLSTSTCIFSIVEGGNTLPCDVAINNIGTGTLNWRALTPGAWVNIAPTSGTAPSTLVVSVNAAGLAIGTYTDVITVEGDLGTLDSPQDIAIELRVRSGKIYLPLVLRNWPPIPGVLTLNPISPNPTCGSYTVSWAEPAGPIAASYYVLQEASRADFGGASPVYEGSQLFYAGSKLEIGRYYYRVRACNTWGCGGWSGTQYVDISVPGVPVLRAIDNLDWDGNYVVSWETTELASGYILQEAVKTSLPSEGDFAQIYAGENNSYSANGKGPTRYYYRVQANNSCGQSAWSNPLQYADVQWEKEPNDDARTQANGPVVSGVFYYGTFPDQASSGKDYFYFHLDVEHSVTIDLTNIPLGQDYDLALWDTTFASPVVYSDKKGNADEHIQTGVLSPGRYYIQVYHNNSGGSTQLYHLRVVYR